ncbi:creatininase family protein [uncultured Aeromicrobium sp.]|uniref:creatininase family protein n=1 Tax=uncultured Aeromicrobium sp. TaxID=337820 RepID=UPI0025F2E2B3|nr:creatininase family protein [uncultured Aeromicrobium sp.]
MSRWADLTTTELARDAAATTAVWPVGAVEQHGPHLPLVTDALIADHTAAQALKLLDDPRFRLLPTLAYGTSGEHIGWPGTLSLSTATMMAVCRDVARSVATAGCPRLVFVNGHGGQVHLLDMVARDIRIETGLMVFTVTPSRLVPPSEAGVADRFDVHGGQEETSLMLHLRPDLVHRDQFAPGGQGAATAFEKLDVLTLENGVSPAWVTSDVSTNGVIGDPTAATPEIGRHLHELATSRLAEALLEIRDFSFPENPLPPMRTGASR